MRVLNAISIFIVSLLLVSAVSAQSLNFNLGQQMNVCSAKQALVLSQRTQLARSVADRLVTKTEALARKSTLSSGNQLDMQVASQILSCARYKLNILQYECTDNQDYLGRTFWVLGRNVEIGAKFFSSTPLQQAGVLIHEATHKCGTTDAAYFSSKNPPHDESSVQWTWIADTYWYWAVYGVCVPQVDCAPHLLAKHAGFLNMNSVSEDAHHDELVFMSSSHHSAISQH